MDPPPLTITQIEACIFVQEPVRPPKAEHSGWHILLSSNYAMEHWYWDTRVSAWRGHPEAFEAETPEQMGCEGYTFLTEATAP